MTGRVEAVLWKSICQESADYGRFGDDLIFKDAVAEFDGGDKATRIDFEIPLVTGAVEWDDDFLVWKIELFQCDCSSVSPGTRMVSVECSNESSLHGPCKVTEVTHIFGLMPLVLLDMEAIFSLVPAKVY